MDSVLLPPLDPTELQFALLQSYQFAVLSAVLGNLFFLKWKLIIFKILYSVSSILFVYNVFTLYYPDSSGYSDSYLDWRFGGFQNT